MFVWMMLWQVGSQVLKLKESIGNVVGHVEVNGASGIIPVDVYAAKKGAAPVHGDGIVFFESGLEMEDMVVRCVFDAKVIDHKTEADDMPHVAPQAWCVLAMIVPLQVELLFRWFVGKDAGLGKAIHTHLDFDVHPTLFIDEIF
jgi:hypothetical protein